MAVLSSVQRLDGYARDAIMPPPRIIDTPDLLGLSRRMLVQDDLAAMLQILGRETGACFRVDRVDGAVLACYPPLHGADTAYEFERSIVMGSAMLGVIAFDRRLDPAVLDIAVAALAHPLSRWNDRELERRRSLGLLLTAIVENSIDSSEALQQLERFGLTCAFAGVIVAHTDGVSSDVAGFVGCVCAEHTGQEHSCPIALTGDSVVQLVLPAAAAEPHAWSLHDRLCRVSAELVHVGIGGTVVDYDTLRMSLLEAIEGSQTAPGVNQRAPLTIAGLLRSQFSGPLRERAEKLLLPIIDHDRRKQTELYETLIVLVEEQYSPARSAKRLFVHVNTVKYRLAQLAELLTIDLHSEEGRAEIWMALNLLGEFSQRRAA